MPGFNSRSRVGSDVVIGEIEVAAGDVSIRAPAWGATHIRVIAEITEQFQFALPRGERLLKAARAITYKDVSIRAPAWGATCE